MAKLDPNTLIGILHGKLGNLVFVRMAGGRVVVRHRPLRKAPATGNEISNQSQFKAALAYVSRICRIPVLYAPYQTAAKIRRKRACDLANADFRLPPIIDDIDLTGYTGRAGDSIRVRATDDFEITQVIVVVTGLDGAVLELGGATTAAGDGAWWRYLAEKDVDPGRTIVVHAAATDRAENVTTKTAHWALAGEGAVSGK